MLVIKWHTHLMALVYVYLFVELIISRFANQRKIRSYVLPIFIGLFSTETILSLTDWVKTHSEKNYQVYVSPYGKQPDLIRYYWVDDPFSSKHLKDPEYSFIRHMNSIGYSNVEWMLKKKKDELRILCLGDSFTEGDGAHKDSSYVSFLRRKLNTKYQQPITVMNAGKCGSDPFFNYINYRDRLSVFQPDIIVQTISTHDITDDIYLRGGMERFGKDSIVSFTGRPHSNMELLYSISYTSRIFFRWLEYNELLVRPVTPKQSEIIQKSCLRLFKDYYRLVSNNQATLVIVFLPGQQQINDSYPPYFLDLIRETRRIPLHTIDLLPYYHALAHEPFNFYWVNNAHHNAKGYEMMADGIFESLEKQGLLISGTRAQ